MLRCQLYLKHEEEIKKPLTGEYDEINHTTMGFDFCACSAKLCKILKKVNITNKGL